MTECKDQRWLFQDYSGVDLDLFHPLIENAHAAAIPSHPHLVANVFGWDFVKGAGHFDVTVAVNVTFGFLVAGKKRVRKPLELSTFLFEKGNDLFARCSVNALVGNMTFPLSEKAVLFTSRLEAPSLQSVGAYVSDP